MTEIMQTTLSELKLDAIADDVLEHYGVKGMRWGVTGGGSSGKKSTSKGDDSSSAKKAPAKKEDSAGSSSKKKDPKKMTTAELSSALQRLQMEKQYKELSQPQKSEGQKLAAKILLSVGQQVAVSYISGHATKGLGKMDAKIAKKFKK